MGLHQYIGARYTPKFYQNSLDPTTCEWESNVTYEPLTIVTTANDHCYISKKTVPDTVGTPADNMEYWLETGNFNAYIQDLQDQIDIIDSDVDSLKTRINRKFIFVGDSYAFGFLPGGDEIHPDITGFYQRVANWMGLDASSYTILAWGRAGFLSAGVNGNTWIQDINTLDDDPDVTDIYVMGGLNDVQYAGDGTALTSAIDAFITRCNTKFPNAKVKIGFCGRLARTNLTISVANLRKTIIYYKSATLLRNAEYLVNSENILKGFPDSMASDFYHPSNTGQDMLAYYVKNDIMGGEPWEYDFPNQSIGITYDSSASAGFTMMASCEKETVTFYARQVLEVMGTFTGDLMKGNFFELCTLSTDAFIGSPDNACVGNCIANVSADGKNYLCHCSILLNNNKVYIYLFNTGNDTVLPTVTTVSGIYILPFSITLPKNMLV